MTDHGTLIVRVFTTRAQIPVDRATIAVTQRGPDGKHTLLSVRVTDESGRIEPIHISTPALDLSLEPGSGTGFTLCDIWAEHPQYQLLLVEGVQLFPGVETVQNMALLPLAEHAIPRNEADLVEITPQPL